MGHDPISDERNPRRRRIAFRIRDSVVCRPKRS
jgi:hypothetical protein